MFKRAFHYWRRFNIGYNYYKPKIKELIRWTFYSRESDNFSYDISDQSKKYLSYFIQVTLNCNENVVFSTMQELYDNQELKEYVLTKIHTLNRQDIEDNFYFGRRVGWYTVARILKPRIIIETGVDRGLGSLVLCSALEKNISEGYEGKYYGTDINNKAGFLFCDSPWEKYGEILFGDSILSLKSFKEKIDLFINDSDHSKDYEMEEYLTIKDKLSEKAIILGDNSHASDSLMKFSSLTNRHFLFFKEVPVNHWYPGGGIGFSFPKTFSQITYRLTQSNIQEDKL